MTLLSSPFSSGTSIVLPAALRFTSGFSAVWYLSLNLYVWAPKVSLRRRVAGFSPEEISITAEQNVVTIEGGKTEKPEREFLYRGISTRHFKRQFNLADYVQVKDATFDNGLLKIELVREIPEAMKPRRIAINGVATADNVHQIDAKAA